MLGIEEMRETHTDIAAVEFAGAIHLLVRRLRAATPPDGLSLSETSALGRLGHEGPATTAGLARAERITPQSMGTVVAALEARKLIKRLPHPTDGRQRLLHLTAQGTAAWKKNRHAKELWLTEAVATLSRRDRETLFRAGKILHRLAQS